MSRAKELSTWEPPEPSIDEVRRSLGGPQLADDELILRYIVSKDEIDAMRAAAKPIVAYPTPKTALVALIHELTKRSDLHHIHIQKGNLNLTLRKSE